MEASTTAVHARLASAPLRRESRSAATNGDDDALPLVKREPADKLAQWSSGYGSGMCFQTCGSLSHSSLTYKSQRVALECIPIGGGKTVAANLEQATRAQKFFRSHKLFGLQPAGFRPEGLPTATAGPVSTFDSSGSVYAPPRSSAAAALTNRGRPAASSSGVLGGSMQGSTTVLTADKQSKWERYQRYGNVGIAGSGGGRASQRHVAVPMSVAGCHTHWSWDAGTQQKAKSATSRPSGPQIHRGPAAVAAAACRVQRTRAVSPHVQGPNSVSVASGSPGSMRGKR